MEDTDTTTAPFASFEETLRKQIEVQLPKDLFAAITKQASVAAAEAVAHSFPPAVLADLAAQVQQANAPVTESLQRYSSWITRSHAKSAVGIADLRAKTKDLIDHLDTGDVVVMRHTKPVAVMIHPERLERLLSRIEDLEDELALAERGDTISSEQARKELGL